MARWWVYTLSHPHTGEVRYVGVANRLPSQRLREHVSHSKRERNHRACWIRNLIVSGLRPVMTVVDSGTGDWRSRERHWIAEFRLRLGDRLTNATDGGEGTLGWVAPASFREKCRERNRSVHTGQKRTSEARANMRNGQLRRVALERETGVVRGRFTRTPETLKRMSDAQRGKVATAATREKLSKSHSNPSEETREKLRQSVLQRPAEQRQAFAHNQKGKPKSESHRRKISEARKRAWQQKKGG